MAGTCYHAVGHAGPTVLEPERRRYRILFDLASGGMGVVAVGQRLEGPRAGALVAIKRVHRELSRDPEFHGVLGREFALGARIVDRRVVGLIELLDQDGAQLLVMELVPGVSLRKLLDVARERGERVPLPIALEIARDVASALAAAHSTVGDDGRTLGIVHRDVSPHNVLISYEGLVKVTDFGVARAIAVDSVSRSLSRLRGKPAYFAPEQLRGGRASVRSDVWSLGVVAFELLTGKRLFKGRSDLETLRNVLEAEIPRVDVLRPDVPSAVADTIERALLRDPQARWQRADLFAEALGEHVGDGPSTSAALAALVRSWLPDEEARFADQVARARRRGSAEARQGGARGARFAGLAAVGFLATLTVRIWAAPSGAPADRWEDPPPERFAPPPAAIPPRAARRAPAREPERAGARPPDAVVPVEREPPPAALVPQHDVEPRPAVRRAPRPGRKAQRRVEFVEEPTF
jgi:hypothetical protein